MTALGPCRDDGGGVISDEDPLGARETQFSFWGAAMLPLGVSGDGDVVARAGIGVLGTTISAGGAKDAGDFSPASLDAIVRTICGIIS